jgi:hypothetical protein
LSHDLRQREGEAGHGAEWRLRLLQEQADFLGLSALLLPRAWKIELDPAELLGFTMGWERWGHFVGGRCPSVCLRSHVQAAPHLYASAKAALCPLGQREDGGANSPGKILGPQERAVTG